MLLLSWSEFSFQIGVVSFAACAAKGAYEIGFFGSFGAPKVYDGLMQILIGRAVKFKTSTRVEVYFQLSLQRLLAMRAKIHVPNPE